MDNDMTVRQFLKGWSGTLMMVLLFLVHCFTNGSSLTLALFLVSFFVHAIVFDWRTYKLLLGLDNNIDFWEKSDDKDDKNAAEKGKRYFQLIAEGQGRIFMAQIVTFFGLLGVMGSEYAMKKLIFVCDVIKLVIRMLLQG